MVAAVTLVGILSASALLSPLKVIQVIPCPLRPPPPTTARPRAASSSSQQHPAAITRKHSSNRLSFIDVPVSEPHSLFVQRIVDFLLKPLTLAPSSSSSAAAAAGTLGNGSVSSVGTLGGLPFFQAQQEHLIAEIRHAKRARHPLLVEGGPGIGKGSALLAYVQDQALLRPAIYLKLDDVLAPNTMSDSMVAFAGIQQRAAQAAATAASELDLPDSFSDLASVAEPLSANTGSLLYGSPSVRGNAAHLVDAWTSALETAFGMDYVRQEQLYDHDGNPLDMSAVSFDHVVEALRLIRGKSRYGPTLLVIDNLQVIFNDQQESVSEIHAAFNASFQWLLYCETEGILDTIFCSSSKSVMLALKRFHGFDKRLRYRSVESVDDLDVIDYLLDQVNPTIPESRQFTEETAHLFVQTFDGNLAELERYCSSGLTVQDYIAQREDVLLEYIQRHIPTRPQAKRASSNPYAPPVSEDSDFKDIILDMIMRNGVLSIAQMDSERLALVEVLVENNFLRWRDARVRRRERSQPSRRRRGSFDTRSEFSTETLDEIPTVTLTEQERQLQEQQMSDPFAFMQHGDTELVWYNRLVGSVCERWFNQQAW
ncbi:hypothetical protein BC831DRAFT_436257 [Entophlyctis helioformis]|nr:hypothetical protein BC831DRAFT_436257 [Entophlyctis helioformis]